MLSSQTANASTEAVSSSFSKPGMLFPPFAIWTAICSFDFLAPTLVKLGPKSPSRDVPWQDKQLSLYKACALELSPLAAAGVAVGTAEGEGLGAAVSAAVGLGVAEAGAAVAVGLGEPAAAADAVGLGDTIVAGVGVGVLLSAADGAGDIEAVADGDGVGVAEGLLLIAADSPDLGVASEAFGLSLHPAAARAIITSRISCFIPIVSFRPGIISLSKENEAKAQSVQA